jgi:hypothetical protein
MSGALLSGTAGALLSACLSTHMPLTQHMYRPVQHNAPRALRAAVAAHRGICCCCSCSMQLPYPPTLSPPITTTAATCFPTTLAYSVRRVYAGSAQRHHQACCRPWPPARPAHGCMMHGPGAALAPAQHPWLS